MRVHLGRHQEAYLPSWPQDLPVRRDQRPPYEPSEEACPVGHLVDLDYGPCPGHPWDDPGGRQDAVACLDENHPVLYSPSFLLVSTIHGVDNDV